MASGTRQRNRGRGNPNSTNPPIGTGERGGRTGVKLEVEQGGRVQPRGVEFVTRDDLMAEMRRLQNSIQAMFDQSRHNEAETPDPGLEDEMPITPTVIPVPRRCDYKMFLSCRPPTYAGERDPVKAMQWMKEIETVFKASKCAEEDKVLYGAAMLKADALYWWDSLIASRGSNVYSTFTWDEFSTAFKEQFCPQAAVRQLEEEFMSLQQGNLSVRDYTARFLEKSRFAEYYVATEKLKMERFIFGLNSEIRKLTTATRPETFSAAVNVAENVERDIKRDAGDKNVGKRKWEGPQYDSKKSRFQRYDNRPSFRPTERPCPKCNRVHQGNCQGDSRACYKCGKTGHVIKDCKVTRLCFLCNSPDHLQIDCPQGRVQQGGSSNRPSITKPVVPRLELPVTRGRAFQMTEKEAEETPDVVAGGGSGKGK